MTEPWAAWTPEPEEDAARAAPAGFAGVLGQVRPDPDEGKTLEQVFAPALRPDKPTEAADADERMANLMARGYRAGGVSDTARRLADVTAELQAEREKIAAGERNAARVERMRQAGQLTALEAWQRLDGDYGDAGRAERLERRVARLRSQLEDVAGTISPSRAVSADPVEAALGHAREVAGAVSRSAPEPRPFEAPDCAECAAAGATAAESAQIHAGALR
jgi:hypothetical protein